MDLCLCAVQLRKKKKHQGRYLNRVLERMGAQYHGLLCRLVTNDVMSAKWQAILA